MTTLADADWTRTYMRVLGDELRAVRKARGWTRQDLLDHLGLDISLQTLATWELGTRAITVTRLAQVTTALEATASDVVARTHQRVFDDVETAAGWTIDLVAASRLSAPELAPLRAWAAARLQALSPNTPRYARLSRAAVDSLAVLCGMDPDRLARRLPRLALELVH